MPLVDAFNRVVEYLRVSVTDQCNLRCVYCRPEKINNLTSILTSKQLGRLVAAFARCGVARVRITGGEPLVRRDLLGVIEQIKSIETIDDLSLSTNGVLLKRYAKPLFQAGVQRINVSLDTLNPERYKRLSGGGRLEKVLCGLHEARAVGFSPIKINMLVMRNVNLDEILPMVEYCVENGFLLRFIETMPIGDPGFQASRYYVDLEQIKRQLLSHYNFIPELNPGGGPARCYRLEGTDSSVGFITPISRHFCASCNRVRIAANGDLYLCLGSNHRVHLGKALESGVSDRELDGLLQAAIQQKPEKHSLCVTGDGQGVVNRLMSLTGG